jgi:hypothetical protein
VGTADEISLPCRTCRSVTGHTLAQPATTDRGMTTEVWTCSACGTLESRSYRAGATPEPVKHPARSAETDSVS